MRVFNVRVKSGFGGALDARHKHSLPGVHCDVCGAIWASVGLAYPSIDVSRLTQPERFSARNVSWQEFAALRDEVSRLANGRLLKPGTALGRLVGSVKGHISTDFIDKLPWTICIGERATKILLTHSLGGVLPIEIDLGPAASLRAFELEIAPRARLAEVPSSAQAPCEQCGRRAGFKTPKSIVLNSSSIPQDADVFRGEDLTTHIFATERFVDICRHNDFRGVDFDECAVA